LQLGAPRLVVDPTVGTELGGDGVHDPLVVAEADDLLAL